MPSNTDKNGQIVFDAGKRIKQSFGEEFTNNVEAGGIKRLNLAGAGGAIRAAQGNTNTESKQNFFAKVQHTNPIEKQNETPSDNTTQECGFRIAFQNVFSNTYVFPNKDAATLHNMTGISAKADTASRLEAVAGLTSRVVVDAVSRGIISTSLKCNSSIADKAKVIGTTSVASTFVNSMLSINHQEFDGIIEVPGITRKDALKVKQISYVEALKYNAIRTASVKVLPAAMKIVADKVLPAKVKNNAAYRIGTGYNLLSTVAGLVFGRAYAHAAAKCAVKTDEKLSTTDLNRTEFIRDSVRSMSKIVLSAQVNPDLYISGTSAIVDTVSEVINCVKESKKAAVKSQIIKDNLVKDTNAPKVKVIVVKPVKTASKATKVSK